MRVSNSHSSLLIQSTTVILILLALYYDKVVVNGQILSASSSSIISEKLGVTLKHNTLHENIRKHLSAARPSFYREIGSEVESLSVNYGGKDPFEQRRRTKIIPSDDDNVREELGYSQNGVSPIRIQFITDPLEAARGTSEILDRKIELIINQILPQAADVWSQHLHLLPVSGNIEVPSDICFGSFENELLPSRQTSFAADLVIVVSVNKHLMTPTGDSVSVCGPGGLAVGTSCALDQYDRPIVGFINFCLDDYYKDLGQEWLDFVHVIAVHEIAHVLAMDAHLFKFYRDPETGIPRTPRPFVEQTVTCVDGEQHTQIFPSNNTLREGRTKHGMIYYDVVTPRVTQVARNHFDCQTLPGARLENQHTSRACIGGSHWDERLFLSELMGPLLQGDSNYDILSPLTLALMEDSGWYTVSYHNSRLPPFGHGAGCEFVTDDCIVNDAVPSYGREFFCDSPIRLDSGVVTDETLDTVTCDTNHLSWALCDLWDVSTIPDHLADSFPPIKVKYFSDVNLLPSFSQADYCPLPIEPIGFDCTISSDEYEPYYGGEAVGPHSRCVNAYSETAGRKVSRPACMHIRCDVDEHRVVIGQGKFEQVCHHDGEVLQFPFSVGDYMVCPKLSSVCPQLFCPANCSGRGVCDFDVEPPVCRCFDENNKSSGCFEEVSLVDEGLDENYAVLSGSSNIKFLYTIAATLVTALYNLC